MILVEYDRKFKKQFRKRILPNKKLVKRFKERLQFFLENPTHPLLKDHKLKGEKKEYRAFWITGDIRVVYQKVNNVILLYDIGSHAQVY